MLRRIDIRYTDFNDLREGDEFVRVGGLPVLLRDITGTRAGGTFTPWFFGRGRSLDIRRMERMPGGRLRETNLTETSLTRSGRNDAESARRAEALP